LPLVAAYSVHGRAKMGGARSVIKEVVKCSSYLIQHVIPAHKLLRTAKIKMSECQND